MAYGQRYVSNWCSQLSYPINAGVLNTFTAKIFQRGYITGGGIILTPAQVTSASSLLVGGITLSATDGVITMPWTATLIDEYGEYPLIWAYYNGQKQPIFPVLDDTDAVTEITIDIGTIPDTDLILVIKKADSTTQYTSAFLTGTGGIITVAVTSQQVFWIYFDGQWQAIVPVLDDNDNPTSVTIDLGTIPATNAYLQQKTPDFILDYTVAEITTSGGVITIPANIDDYGQYPQFYAVYDGQFQPITPVVTPTEFIIDLGTIPATDTHILIVSGGYAVGITELSPAFTPATIEGTSGDPRNKMEPLKGSGATLHVTDMDLEDIWTDDETEYYAEIQLSKPDDTFTITWSNTQVASPYTDANLQIKKYSPASNPVSETIVDAFVNESGTVEVLRGDRITILSYVIDAWPAGQCYMKLDTTGIVSQMIDNDGDTILFDFEIDKDITVVNEAFNEADFMALRSDIFYNQTSNYPVTYSQLYHGASQAAADALAAADADFYTDGQANADAWPIGFAAIWRGFLNPDTLQQAFQTKAVLDLSFVDGIGRLKNLLFVDESGNFFLGKATPQEIIYYCLSRIAIPDMNVYIHSELFEDNMDEAADPMTQVLHQLETYFLSTQTKPLDCAAVLEAVLRVYGLEIRQNLGEWWVTQIDSLYDTGAQTWYRYSWITGELIETVSRNWTRVIGCSAESVDNIFTNADQLKIIDRSYRGQILRYQYKSAQNVNENPNLIPTPYGGGYLWPGWTVVPTGSGNVNPGADNNGARMDSDATRPADPSVITIMGDNIAVDAADLLNFDFNFSNTGPVAFSQLQVKFTNGAQTWYLDVTGAWILTTPTTIYTYNGQVLRDAGGPVPPGDYLAALDTDLSFTIAAEAIPGALSGNVNIILYNYDYSQNNTLAADEQNDPTYPNFSGTTTWNLAKASFVIAESAEGTALGTFYIAKNIGDPTFTPDIINILNADDNTARYVGTLYQGNAPSDPTRFWHRLGSGESKPLAWIIAEMYVRMYQEKFRIMTGSLGLWYPQLTRFTFDDTTRWPGVYMNVGTDYDLGTLLHQANLIQISNVDITGAPATTEEIDYGQYNDGDLPVIQLE